MGIYTAANRVPRPNFSRGKFGLGTRLQAVATTQNERKNALDVQHFCNFNPIAKFPSILAHALDVPATESCKNLQNTVGIDY